MAGTEIPAASSTGKGKKVVGRPFPKGVSGNPNGRPPGIGRLGTALRGLMDRPVSEVTAELKNPFTKQPFPEGTTMAQAFATIVAARAFGGDKTCIPLVHHYVDGLPRQSLDISGGLEGMLEVLMPEGFDKL